jgi:tetratricopeptide (TPR) repeat protein
MEKTSVVFLPVPDSLKDDLRAFLANGKSDAQALSLQFEPSILIPAELDQGENKLDPERLSWETILSGMLRIISAYGRSNTTAGAAIKNGDIVEPGTVCIPETDNTSGKACVPPKWIDYYRWFVLTVKPEIYNEFTGASIIKAKNGGFDMALEINAILEGLFPGSPGVLLNKALILENKALAKNAYGAGRENAEALNAYETALSLEPILPDTHFNAGFFFMRLGEYKRAKDCFSTYISEGEEPEKKRQALKIIKDISSQGLDDDIFMEAYNDINVGNDEKGLTGIRDFLERRPKVWNGWFVLGWALRKLGRYSDGLEAFIKAVELGGRGLDLKNEMAICFMELGNFKAARKELEQALHDDPENVKIISNFGVLAVKTGNRKEAASYFRTVLELDPNDGIAKRFLGSGE